MLFGVDCFDCRCLNFRNGMMINRSIRLLFVILESKRAWAGRGSRIELIYDLVEWLFIGFRHSWNVCTWMYFCNHESFHFCRFNWFCWSTSSRSKVVHLFQAQNKRSAFGNSRLLNDCFLFCRHNWRNWHKMQRMCWHCMENEKRNIAEEVNRFTSGPFDEQFETNATNARTPNSNAKWIFFLFFFFWLNIICRWGSTSFGRLIHTFHIKCCCSCNVSPNCTTIFTIGHRQIRANRLRIQTERDNNRKNQMQKVNTWSENRNQIKTKRKCIRIRQRRRKKNKKSIALWHTCAYTLCICEWLRARYESEATNHTNRESGEAIKDRDRDISLNLLFFLSVIRTERDDVAARCQQRLERRKKAIE